MKERPIIMSAPMVRALLAGTKTQTRRILTPGPAGIPDPIDGYIYNGHALVKTDGSIMSVYPLRCPYWQDAGDRLWVRETWHTVDGEHAFYRADYAIDPKDDREHGITWRPSIFMPRWASRITLEVTGVRVERLQDISEADAKAEGLNFVADGCARWGVDGLASSWCDCPVTAYAALWESISGPGSWDANPWVWCIEFRRIGQEGKAPALRERSHAVSPDCVRA